MIKKIHSVLLFALLLGLSIHGTAQLSINFQPAVYGKSVDGLAFAQVLSGSSYESKVSVTIHVKEVRGISVLEIKTAPFVIRQGINAIDRSAFANARFTFANNSFGNTLKQSGNFPEGEYEFCYEIEVLESKDQAMPRYAEHCVLHSVQPLTPLLLIHPIDEDQFCNKRPQFNWQPPMPLPLTARYRLVVTEVKEKQDIVEALAYNVPVINQHNLQTNSMMFPSNAADLKEGQRYAWQVTVYDNNIILKKSEVWEFTIVCQQKTPVLSSGSYRELKENDDGNFYVAGQYLPFTFNNPYGASDRLNYSIKCISAPTMAIKNLPALKLALGLNKFILDLSEIKSMKVGHEYEISVFLPGNRTMRLRFIYKNE